MNVVRLMLALAVLGVSETAPPLALERLLQAPEGAKAEWSVLRSRAVVLEFWAPWCGPCVDNIPHWNALVEQFAGRPVQFIAITDDNPEQVEAFLEERPVAGWIGLDPEGKMFRAYGVEGIPQAVLVDREGKIRGVVDPRQLTSGMLEDVLQARTVAAPRPTAPT